MEGTHTIPYLQEIVMILLSVGIIVPLLARLKIPTVLGYLGVGFIAGPYGLGSLDVPWIATIAINDPARIAPLAEFGIVFLLFMIGLELSPRRLWDMRKLVFGLGTLQILACAAIIGPIAYAFGNSIAASTILAACLSLSSTAIVMQILMEKRKLATPLGRAGFSILLMQDLAVVPILILLGILGAGGEAAIGPAIALALGKSLAVILAIVMTGHFVLRPLFRIAGSTAGPEPFLAVALLVVVVTASLTGMAGLSLALGAFLAGLLLAETEYSHAIEVYIEPFKGILLGLFFMTVGMGLDPRLVSENLFWLVSSVIGLILLKAVIIAPLARMFGLGWGTAIEAGLLLGQAGEFAFVIVAGAMTLGLLPPATGQFMLIMTTLSMLATPGIAFLARNIRRNIEKRTTSTATQPETGTIPEAQGHVIIAGTGRVGRAVASILNAEAIPYLAIDSSAAVIDEKRKSGKTAYYGDASRYEFLRLFHPEKASAVVLTMDDPHATARAIETIRRHWPDLPIHARARDIRLAKILHSAGATSVVPETSEAGLRLATELLSGLGFPEDVIRIRLSSERDRLTAKMLES